MNGDWEPLWIGPPSHRLYAAFHPVLGTPRIGVVIVPPLLHELPRSRRFVAETATVLAQQGIPCLRFDFHGTGDSSGSGEELDFATLRRDIALAVSALRRRVPIRRVCLLAWRASALALQEWEGEADISDVLVLWDPIVEGAAWLAKLTDSDARERAVRPPLRPGVPRIADQADGQLMGFAAPAALRADLSTARLDRLGGGRRPVWAVMSAQAERAPPVSKVLTLPADAPGFNDEAAMDSTFYLTPQMRDLVGHLGRALQMELPA